MKLTDLIEERQEANHDDWMMSSGISTVEYMDYLIRDVMTLAYEAGQKAEREYILKNIELYNQRPSKGLEWLKWFLTRKAGEARSLATPPHPPQRTYQNHRGLISARGNQ